MRRSAMAEDMKMCVSVGLFIGCVFSMWTGLGRLVIGTALLERFGTGWVELSGAHLASGLAGGGLVGLALPVGRRLPRSIGPETAGAEQLPGAGQARPVPAAPVEDDLVAVPTLLRGSRART